MLKILKAGFFTTVQDLGRFGYRNKGVPVSGAMDKHTVAILNKLLENKKEAAVLEITMTGPTLEFQEDTYISTGGAEMPKMLNDEIFQDYKVYKVKKGDVVSYQKLEKGFRSYLAVKGGFQSPEILGSKSFYKPLTPSMALRKNDIVSYKVSVSFQPKIQGIKVASYLEDKVLEVFKGPEYSILTDKHLELLFFENFAIAKENNRMAYQIQDTIEGHSISMLTSATLPGTVQLTPSGKLIILMRNGQTTGGYPRVLQLSEKSVSILAQKKFRDKISFRLIEQE
ncbi:MAG: biotin-dependent carboxyltransferase family protein [Cellulophaga sp.]